MWSSTGAETQGLSISSLNPLMAVQFGTDFYNKSGGCENEKLRQWETRNKTLAPHCEPSCTKVFKMHAEVLLIKQNDTEADNKAAHISPKKN